MTELQPEPPVVVGGRYRLTRKLARGGMAQVYLAHDEVLDRAVAVKTLFAKLADDERFVARFRREASAAANLNHPNIVQVYDWHAEGDDYFIVMEYVPGQDLATLLQSGPVDPDLAVRIGRAAASALECAHQAGILHRDVKPGNILVTATGDVKVADFGVSRAFNSNEKLTETGRVMGTASYFSPEQAQGKQLGPESDLYSLGAVLFEMVTGSPLFAGATPVDIAYKQVHDRPRRARSVNPAVPPRLDAVIDRLLAKDPAQRHRSAAELEAELERVALHPDEPVPTADPAAVLTTTALPQQGPATAVMVSPTMDDADLLPPVHGGGRSTAGRDRGWLVLALAAALTAAVAGVFVFSGLIGGDDADPAATTLPSSTAPGAPTSGAETTQPAPATSAESVEEEAEEEAPEEAPSTTAQPEEPATTEATPATTVATTAATTPSTPATTEAPAEEPADTTSTP